MQRIIFEKVIMWSPKLVYNSTFQNKISESQKRTGHRLNINSRPIFMSLFNYLTIFLFYFIKQVVISLLEFHF